MREYLEYHWERGKRWAGIPSGVVLFEAFMIATAIAMMAVSMIMGKKGKAKGANTDPVIGKRYWSDNIEAFGYYSPRTAKLWVNQIFLQQEELFKTSYLPMADTIGDTYDIGTQGVNTGAVPGFTVDYPGDGMAMNFFDDINELARLCKIVKFSRGNGGNPRLPSHQPGVVCLYINQGYMGLNTANVGTYRMVMSAYPGTVYMLMAQGGIYANEDLWVRYRETTDCGLTISVNPVAIMLDILLDRYPVDEIDFLSAADVGRRLIIEKPYMWFSIAQPPQKYKELIQDLSKKASVALRRTSEGKVGFKLIGETPPGGIESVRVLDIVNDSFEVTVRRPSIENADIINEARGTYLAARYNMEDFTPYRDTVDGAAEYEAMLNAEADYAAKKAAYDSSPTSANQALMDAAEKAYSDAKSTFTSHEDAWAEAESQKEGHYLKGGTFAVNAASIVLTGVRSQQNYNLDFLNWPDDAKAYLEDALIMYEHPLSEGEVVTSFAFNDLEVGSLFKLKIADEETNLDYQFIAEIGEKTVQGFGNEKIRYTFKESGKWYGIIAGEPNVATNPGPIDATPTTITYASLLPVWAVCAQLSPLVRGFPIAAFACHENTIALDGVNYYLITNCITSEKNEDNWLSQDGVDFPSIGILTHDFTPSARHVGPSLADQITIEIPIDSGSGIVELAEIIRNKTGVFGGVVDLFFDEAYAGENFFLLTKASSDDPTNDAGAGFLFRAANISVQQTDTTLAVVLSGIYAADMYQPEVSFSTGDYVAILPATNQTYSYGYSSVPICAAMGHTNQIGTQSFKVKAEPVCGTEVMQWSACKCGLYSLDDRWLDTVPVDVFACNRTSPEWGDPSAAVHARPDDVVDIWIALHDMRRLASDPNMLDIIRAFTGCGPEHDMAVQDTLAINDSTESNGGVRFANVVVEFINKSTGVVLVSVHLVDNKLHINVVPRNIIPTFGSTDAISVRVTVGYSIEANSLLDQRTELREITIEGPEIRYA